MSNQSKENSYKEALKELAANCGECCGICCVALYFTKMDGFPEDKRPGKPCSNLTDDFKCKIHSDLMKHQLKGCMAYDCFGAGQKVTREIYKGLDWREHSDCAGEMFQVFLIVYQLHQMLWYLIEAHKATSKNIQNQLTLLIQENKQMTKMKPAEILGVDVEEYRQRVNSGLKEVCHFLNKGLKQDKKTFNYMGKSFKKQNLDGEDFSMALLIAADLEGCSLRKTNFLGADMRDANLNNTDLSDSLFLTQMQINTARGNSNTIIPESLIKPDTWK